MAHNRTTQYSAPFRRNNLLGLPQYAASNTFPTLGTWDRARSDDMYVVKGTVGRSHPVSITVVGAISSDKASLQPHGNYNPSYTSLEDLPKKARLQFYLTCPADDPDFSSDYALALKRLKAIQDDVSASDSRREHFIEGANLKMNFLLFEEKEPEEHVAQTGVKNEEDTDREPGDDSDAEDNQPTPPQPPRPPYEVTSPYKDAWAEVSKTHHNNIMEVYGVDELPVDYRRFHKVLVAGTTVVASFVLKHYAIREKGGTAAASDTYTALVQSISVLKEAEKKVRPSSAPRRRPLPVPQLPSRGTLAAAANAFAPVRVTQPPVSTSPGLTAGPRGSAPTSVASVDTSPVVPSGRPVETSLSQLVTSAGSSTSGFSALLLELGNPDSRFFNPALLAAINQLSAPTSQQPAPPTVQMSLPSAVESSSISSDATTTVVRASSPAVSSTSTLSSSSDSHSALADGDVATWTDLAGAASAGDGTINADAGNAPESIPDPSADGVTGRSLSALSFSEDDMVDDAEDEDDNGAGRKKRKTTALVALSTRKGKNKKPA